VVQNLYHASIYGHQRTCKTTSSDCQQKAKLNLKKFYEAVFKEGVVKVVTEAGSQPKEADDELSIIFTCTSITFRECGFT